VPEGPVPPAAVVRISRGNFAPERFAEVHETTLATTSYLVPAIKALPGLIRYYAGTSPDGSVVHVSIWKSAEHAEQMSRLKEMIVDTRQAYVKAGVTFTAIVNYPIDWTI
jgi:quinol monooxygenase YgiN